MPRALKYVVAALAPVAAVAIYLVLTLPPRSATLGGGPGPAVVFGGYHIHSARSDGTGSVDEITAAAARAGLAFIILTDHGDATRPPLPPAYLHGVLCIDGVEVNTDAGHLVALGLSTPAPYPLAGDAADVLEDVHRLGGWGVIAHPDSPKPELRWRAPWTLPYDGVEWLNADSEWRGQPAMRLLATLGRYLIRPPESVASLFERPIATLRRWDAATRVRPLVALAALDAHARIGWDEAEEPRRRTVFARPTYGDMFRTLAQAAVLDQPLSHDAARDAAAILAALRGGHTYSVLRAAAWPAALEFRATNAAGVVAHMGDALTTDAPVTFDVSVPDAAAARIVLYRDGQARAAGQGRLEHVDSAARGAYRIEVFYPGSALPWILSNPIYVNLAGTAAPPGDERPPMPPALRFVAVPGNESWTIEKSASSSGSFGLEGPACRFTFALGAGEPAGQYAALVSAVRGDEGFDRLAFTARADRPMRLSVQVRLPSGRDGQRWRKSVYVDQTPRTAVLRLEDFEPVGMNTTQRPIVARIHALLFVVDTLNTSPGTRGTVWLSNVALGVGNPNR